jgi:hypothetical protein
VSGFFVSKFIPSIHNNSIPKFLGFFFLLLLMMVIWNCIGNPVSSDINISYTPLNVGDVRQLISHADSSTILFSVIGKTKRMDGTEVFVMEWKSGIQNLAVFYYLVKNGYYMATELDTTRQSGIDISINPFGEQRLAKSYPVDGEVWQHTIGDTNSLFWLSRSVGQLSTFCGSFDNVFGFTLFDEYESSVLTTYYSKGIGWIGTSTSFFPNLDFSCSYVRVNGKVYGHLWPEKDPTIIPIDKQKRLIAIISQCPFLIQQLFQINGETIK